MRRCTFTASAAVALLMVVALFAAAPALVVAAEGDDSVTLEDIKCQACDYAVREWVRHSVLADVECQRLAASAAAPLDAQLATILPTNEAGDAMVDLTKECDTPGGVNNQGVDGVAGALCKELFLDAFPYVEEFPADGTIETDREKMWIDPAAYWDATPEGEQVAPMASGDVAMLRRACEIVLPLGRGASRAKAVATIRGAVRTGRFGELEARILAEKKEELAIVADNAEAAAKAELTSAELDDEEATGAAVAKSVKEERTRFLLQAKRQAVYDVILAMQRDMCSSACDAGMQRSPFDRRVRGWSATLKRL